MFFWFSWFYGSPGYSGSSSSTCSSGSPSSPGSPCSPGSLGSSGFLVLLIPCFSRFSLVLLVHSMTNHCCDVLITPETLSNFRSEYAPDIVLLRGIPDIDLVWGITRIYSGENKSDLLIIYQLQISTFFNPCFWFYLAPPKVLFFNS